MRTLVALLVLLFVSAAAWADGNVTATLTGKTLTLTGDEASNRVAVTKGGRTAAYTITGVSGTTVNGAASAVFDDVRSFRVALAAGDDRVDFTSVDVRGDVRIRLDDGNDSVFFTATTVRGRTTVRCGAGTDTVRTDSSSVFHGPLVVKGEAGNDEVQIVSAQFRSRLRVEAGNDDDHVLLSGVKTLARVRVEVVGGHGLDFLEVVGSQFLDDLWADLGPDDDRARLVTTSFGRDVSVFGGLGEDDVLSIEGGVSFLRLTAFDGFEEP